MAAPEPRQDPARIDLESKLTFLERTVEVMSKVMREQGEQIDRLERQLGALMANLEAAADEGADLRPHDDPPPHY